ncbi:hypothetical protein FA15DRAFT_606483, partial [Coprinopsis marcescibilis]
ESAGSATVRPSGPSDPSQPLQLEADFHWIPDTGATAHMTPHGHWLRDYKPLSFPVTTTITRGKFGTP